MPSVSAVDAISPAIHRTRTFLFRPFRWRTYLKLCLVAIITEGFGGSFNFSWPGNHSSGHGHFAGPAFTFTPLAIAMTIAASLLALIVCFFIFYLITRLRFAYFHCLIHNIREIRPGWRLYRAPAIRFFWLNVVVGLCFLLLVALIALPFVLGFWSIFRNIPPGGHPNVASMLFLILPLTPTVFLVVFAAFAADMILRDWMLPHFALENATAREAWTAIRARIKAEKGLFFVYALLRLVLPFAAIMAVFIVLIIPGLILVAAGALLALVIHSAFAGATGGAVIAGYLLIALIFAVLLGIAVVAWISLGGPVSTGIRQYALIFYGARYQRLGEILYPPLPGPELNAEGTA